MNNNVLQRARANFNQGNKYKDLGNIDKSIQSFQRAIKIKPDFIRPLQELAKIYESQQDLSAATQCYRRIIGLHSEDHQTHLKLARILQKQNNVYGAIAAYQEALNLRPELNFRVYTQLCNLVLREKSIDTQTWLESSSHSPAVRSELKEVLAKIENKTYFDAYIPLGDNCETGMQFWNIGYQESSFFRFTASRYSVTYNILKNNFQHIFSRENLIPKSNNNGMVLDTKYNISFHSSLKSQSDVSTGEPIFLNDAEFELTFENESSKINYLISKWNKMMDSDRKILFILKNDSKTRRLRERHVSKISDLFLRRYNNHNFKIVCIQLDKFREPEWQNSYLANRYFNYFAPRGTNLAQTSNWACWNQLFEEFPLNLA